MHLLICMQHFRIASETKEKNSGKTKNANQKIIVDVLEEW